jgi:HD-GYP domain-containing protein (c-di-GMP phosphodiesterase class II)
MSDHPDIHKAGPDELLLHRCRRLGAPATLLGEPDATAPWTRLLHVLRIAPPPRHAGTPRPPSRARVAPGWEVMVIPFDDGLGNRGAVAALLLDGPALESDVFEASCRAAGLDPATVREELRPLARFDPAAADLFERSITDAASDLRQLREGAAALEGFTGQLTQSYDTIDLLYALGRSMREPFDPERFLTFVVERLHSTLSFGWQAIVFGQSPNAARGLRGRVFARGDLPVRPAGLAHTATALTRRVGAQPIVLMDVDHLTSDEHPQLLAQAVHCKGRPAGLILAGAKHGPDPMVSSYDAQLLEATSGFISAFADNVSLYEDQHDLFLGTVQALTASIDAKDRYTCGHSERVALLARTLAGALGLPAAERDRIHIAGLVHDVGKIGVPEAVLTKPGKLTDAEFALIRQHPRIGHTILRGIPLLADILPAVLHHHERWDGRGYPDGLTADNIPVYARIIAVADTFDAMSSNRSYRPALARGQVIAEIERSAGTQLDPQVARLVRHLDLTEFDRLLVGHAAQAAAA